MTKAAQQAKELLDSVGWSEPGDMRIEDIAWARGMMVNRREMDGSEGRILMSETETLISVNASINYQPKINYILSHEIGHGIMHRGLAPFFSDNDKTLLEWYAKGEQEKEANEFACELLMPSDLFTRKVKQKRLSLQLIEETAGYFDASKTATFLRYRDLGDYPIMIMFIENGIIKWKTHSKDFPFKWIEHAAKVPAFTVAGDYFYKGVEEAKPAKVDAIEWFPEDYNLLRGNATQKLWEQCFPASRNSILTCLWTA